MATVEATHWRPTREVPPCFTAWLGPWQRHDDGFWWRPFACTHPHTSYMRGPAV